MLMADSRKNNRKASKPKESVSKQQVKAMIRSNIALVQEKKYFIYENSGNVDFNGVIYSVTDVPQGDTDLTRDGDRLLPETLEMRYSWVPGDSVNICRLVVLRWEASSTPTVTSVIQAVGATNAPKQPFTHDTRTLYKILCDDMIRVDTYHLIEIRHRIIKLPKVSMQFQGGGTTGTGKLYVLLLTDSGVSTHPGFDLVFKLWFTDS
jgi:hypothetical protein